MDVIGRRDAEKQSDAGETGASYIELLSISMPPDCRQRRCVFTIQARVAYPPGYNKRVRSLTVMTLGRPSNVMYRSHIFYIAHLESRTNQKRFQCERPIERRE